MSLLKYAIKEMKFAKTMNNSKEYWIETRFQLKFYLRGKGAEGQK